jgi:hypothetical protein
MTEPAEQEHDLTPEEEDELLRRAADAEAHPEDLIPWEQV